MPPCLANYPNTSRRELLVGRRQASSSECRERGNTSERVPSREQEKYRCSIFLRE
jgi:hypothetical protein